MPLILWPHLRAALSAVSTASAPPFAGSARSSPVTSASRCSKRRQELVVEDARRHGEPLRLLDQRAHDARMRVAVAHRRIRAHHVEIAATVLVPQPAAVAVREHDGQRIVVARGVAALAGDRGGDGGTPEAGVAPAGKRVSIPLLLVRVGFLLACGAGDVPDRARLVAAARCSRRSRKTTRRERPGACANSTRYAPKSACCSAAAIVRRAMRPSAIAADRAAERQESPSARARRRERAGSDSADIGP